MLELSQEQCVELENRVVSQMSAVKPDRPDDPFSKLYEIIVRTAAEAAIRTVREYERMISQ